MGLRYITNHTQQGPGNPCCCCCCLPAILTLYSHLKDCKIPSTFNCFQETSIFTWWAPLSKQTCCRPIPHRQRLLSWDSSHRCSFLIVMAQPQLLLTHSKNRAHTVIGKRQEYGWGVTCRSRNDFKIATSPSMGDNLQSLEPRAHCTVCRGVNRLKNVLSKWPSWSELVLGSWLGFYFFQSNCSGLRTIFVVGLIWELYVSTP